MQLYMLLDAMTEILACLNEDSEEEFVWCWQLCVFICLRSDFRSAVNIQPTVHMKTGRQ